MDKEDEIYEAFGHANKFKLGVTTGLKVISAIKSNNIEEVKRLMTLAAGEGGLIILRLTQKDESGKSALQLAEEMNSKELIEVLRGQSSTNA